MVESSNSSSNIQKTGVEKIKYRSQYKRLEIYCNDLEYSRLLALKKSKNLTFVKLAKENLFTESEDSIRFENYLKEIEKTRNCLNKFGWTIKNIQDNKDEFAGVYGIKLQNMMGQTFSELTEELNELEGYLLTILK